MREGQTSAQGESAGRGGRVAGGQVGVGWMRRVDAGGM